jgi:acyl dehydratase
MAIVISNFNFRDSLLGRAEAYSKLSSESFLPGPSKGPAEAAVQMSGAESDVPIEFNVPIDERYFEDYVPGPIFEYGPISVTESEIVDFAKKYDPQSIHTDPEKAARGPFGGLIASGWHTSSLMMRLYADNYLSSVASLASPGTDELRWTKPVRPGDSLWIRVTALDSRRSKSKPNLGIVRVYVEVLNQNRETVMTVKTLNLFRCRPTP